MAEATVMHGDHLLHGIDADDVIQEGRGGGSAGGPAVGVDVLAVGHPLHDEPQPLGSRLGLAALVGSS